MVLVGLGIDCLAEVGSKFVGVIKKSHASLGFGSSYFILAALLTLPFIGAQFIGVWQMHSQVDTHAEIYQAIGDWLRTNTTAESKVGTLEVGMIGYYAERPMVDFAGLLQPEITAQLTPNATYEDAAIWAVTKYSPQYLVLHDGVFQKLEQGYAAKQCTPEKHFYGKDYGYNLNMTIYHCQ